MDAAVEDELFKAQPCDLASYGIEAGKCDGLGRIVDDKIDPREVFKGPDIASLASDDPALHLVVGQRHDRHGGFAYMIGGAALDSQRDDLARHLVAVLLELTLDLLELDGGVMAGVILDLTDDDALGLLDRHAGDLLQHFKLTFLDRSDLFLKLFVFLELFVELFFLLLHALVLAVDGFFLLQDASFLLFDVLVSLFCLPVELSFGSIDLFLCLD